MAITNTCLLFQQFSKTIQKDIESGYCMHAILFYSVNNSRDDFKSLLASVLYIYLFYLYEVKWWKRHLGQIVKVYN